MKITRNKLKEIIHETLTENKEYETFFLKALEKNGKSITDMSQQELKSFFKKVDSAWVAKGEKKPVGEATDSTETPDTNSTDFQEFFKRSLEKVGKSITSMTPDEKKKFFNQIDASWNGRGEKKEVDESWKEMDGFVFTQESLDKASETCPDCEKQVTESALNFAKVKVGDKIENKFRRGKSYTVVSTDGTDIQLKNLVTGNIITVFPGQERNYSLVESKLNEDSETIKQISANTGVRTVAIEKFIKDNNLNDREINKDLQRGNLRSRLDFAYAVTGNPNNKYSQFFIKKYKLSESKLNENTPTVYKSKGSLFVDSDFVNNSKGKLPNSELQHSGMGDFFLRTNDGGIYFDRVGKKFSGMVGRGHRIKDNKDGHLMALLFKKMGAKIVTESINEDSSNDDILMIKIGGEKGQFWPWYFQKIDSTHFKMGNNEKSLSTGSAMVHHVGQHRGETYYQSLVDWLHGKLKTKQLNGKEFKGNG